MATTIGIEIETTIRSMAAEAHGARVGSYRTGAPLPESVAPAYGSTHWRVKYDGSLRSSPGRIPCEVVSPVVVADAAGIEHIRQVLTDLRDNLDARPNSSCGTHIHVRFDSTDGPALRRLLCFVANYERALYSATGTPRREHGAWCRGLKSIASVKSVRNFKPTQLTGVDDLNTKLYEALNSRYRILNVCPILSGRQPTVEFRLFSGTTNPDKVVAWVRLVLAIVEYAEKGRKALKWESESQTSGYYKGTGRAEMKRMFYRLGWIKGQGVPTRGVIEGLDDNGPNGIKACRNTLYGLADRYDERL